MLLTIVSLIFTLAIACGAGSVVRFVIMKRPCKSAKSAFALSLLIEFAFYVLVSAMVLFETGDSIGMAFGVADFVAIGLNYLILTWQPNKNVYSNTSKSYAQSTDSVDSIGPGVEVIQKSGKRVVYVKSTNKNNGND